eukprot:460258-Prymnesium_polylepis.1
MPLCVVVWCGGVRRVCCRAVDSPRALGTHVVTTNGCVMDFSSARSCWTCSVCLSRITSDFFMICGAGVAAASNLSRHQRRVEAAEPKE